VKSFIDRGLVDLPPVDGAAHPCTGSVLRLATALAMIPVSMIRMADGEEGDYALKVVLGDVDWESDVLDEIV
jgi:hypothetical protein